MTRLTDALGYATRLATTLCEKHYRADAPQWKPLPDLLGVLTQIDNMTSGLSRAIEAELSKQEPVVWVPSEQLAAVQASSASLLTAWPKPVGACAQPLYTAPLPSAPDTVQVPREPTEQMIAAGAYARNPEVRKDLSGSNDSHRLRRQVTRMWSAMIAAAPKSTP